MAEGEVGVVQAIAEALVASVLWVAQPWPPRWILDALVLAWRADGVEEAFHLLRVQAQKHAAMARPHNNFVPKVLSAQVITSIYSEVSRSPQCSTPLQL